jgi:hypothetical protein
MYEDLRLPNTGVPDALIKVEDGLREVEAIESMATRSDLIES